MDNKDVNNKRDIITNDDSNKEPPTKKLCVKNNAESELSMNKNKPDKQVSPTDAGHSENPDFTSESKEGCASSNKSMEVVDENVEKTTEIIEGSAEEKESPVPVEDFNANECTNPTGSKESINDDNNIEARKKIKWDCDSHLSDAADQENAVNNIEPADVSNDSPPIRDKCIYGSQCYRTSASHKSRFRHPGDSDYDIPDTRPQCPYGVNCYRKNLKHKREFQHSTRGQSRTVRNLQQRIPDVTSESDYSTDEESVDESVYEPSVRSESSDEYKSDIDERSDVDNLSDYDGK